MQNRFTTIKLTRKSINSLLLLVFSVSIWVNSFNMFMWRTYHNGVLTVPLTALRYAGFGAIFVFFFINNRKLKIKRSSIIAFIVSFILIAKMLIFTTYTSSPLILYYWMIPIYVFLLMQLEEEEKQQVLKYSIVLFFIFSIPSIVYSILANIGIGLPFSILYSDQELKNNVYTYYHHYPLGLIYNQWGFMRPCGIFDEPGFIGTLSAIFFSILLQKGINKDNIKQLIGLLLIGVLSTSLAAIILFIIAIGVYIFIQKFYKALMAICILIIGFLVFMNVDFQNETLRNYQERLTITNGALEGNTRESDMFKQDFDEMVENDPATFLLGYGINAKSELLPKDGSCSYRTFIYEYGLIGFALMLLLLTLIFLHCYKSNYSLIPFVAFVASLYQRPFVIMPLYVTIFIVGFSAINPVKKSLFRMRRKY